MQTRDLLRKELVRRGIKNHDHVIMLIDTFDKNWEAVYDWLISLSQQRQQKAQSSDDDGDGHDGRTAELEEVAGGEEEEERIENVLMGMYHFRTMNDTKEVYYYDENKGIYVAGGEIVIETWVEMMDDKVSFMNNY